MFVFSLHNAWGFSFFIAVYYFVTWNGTVHISFAFFEYVWILCVWLCTLPSSFLCHWLLEIALPLFFNKDYFWGKIFWTLNVCQALYCKPQFTGNIWVLWLSTASQWSCDSYTAWFQVNVLYHYTYRLQFFALRMHLLIIIALHLPSSNFLSLLHRQWDKLYFHFPNTLGF